MAKQGYGIAYAADACVIHSHNYSCRQQFHRILIWVFPRQIIREIFEGVPSEGEGLRLVKKSLAYLIKNRAYLAGSCWQGKVASNMGYFLGKRYKKLPKKGDSVLYYEP